jgi:hypothetical protein
LDGGLERRIYELARKHCVAQAKWIISLELLHKKSGSVGPVKRFREFVKKIARIDSLPDYRISYDSADDKVMFYSKNPKNIIQGILDAVANG